MISLPNEWTLVFPGPWNVDLFRPDWLMPRFFDGHGEIELEVLVGPSPTIRLRVGDLVIVPRADKLVIGVRRPTEEACLAAEGFAVGLLETFDHLPLKSFGVNFGFEADQPPDRLAEALVVGDRVDLNAFPSEIESTLVKRRLRVEEKTLNIQISHEEPLWKIHLNFHHEVQDPAAAREQIPTSLAACLDIGLRLLDEVYDLQLEDADDRQ